MTRSAVSTPASAPSTDSGGREPGSFGDYTDAYELQLMRGVKELVDPAGLMNPGKVVPNA
jgi:FAD/FMN-containing dehydrogenase